MTDAGNHVTEVNSKPSTDRNKPAVSVSVHHTVIFKASPSLHFIRSAIASEAWGFYGGYGD